MVGILNRVGMLISTTGTGTVTADALISNRFNTPAEAGAVNGESYYWLLEQGNDYEIFEGVWTLSGTLISRDTVIESKISGVHGTTKLTLDGSAMLRSISPKEAFIQGWTQIGSTVTVSSPVATVTLSDLNATPYGDFMLVLVGVSHNGTGGQNLKVKVSTDGSTFSTDVVESTLDGVAPTGTLNASLHMVGINTDISVADMLEAASLASNLSIAVSSVSTKWRVRHDGGIAALQLVWSSGSFDAGTIKLFGR